MTAALTHSSYVETFQFSVGQRTVRVSSDAVLISGSRLCHADGSMTEKLLGLKPAVLIQGTTRSNNL